MVDKSRSRKEGGAGIGMALCKKIISLHGGVLKIDSRLGEGTVIKVVFPIAAFSEMLYNSLQIAEERAGKGWKQRVVRNFFWKR